MTAQRQENKDQRLRIACVAILGLAVWAASVFEVRAAATERLVVNRHTGLVIDGFDPVAYFTDAMALAGQSDVEVSAQGAVWRFRNEANRAIFLAHPDVYGPRFGGYDPTDVARGKPVAGRAQVWMLHGERLYLFGRTESRDAFAADPDGILKQAETRWPMLMDTLADY